MEPPPDLAGEREDSFAIKEEAVVARIPLMG